MSEQCSHVHSSYHFLVRTATAPSFDDHAPDVEPDNPTIADATSSEAAIRRMARRAGRCIREVCLFSSILLCLFFFELVVVAVKVVVAFVVVVFVDEDAFFACY